MPPIIFIDWIKVQKDYSGIEFNNYDKTEYLYKPEYLWYTTIDVLSGCIWNLKLIDAFNCLS